MVKSTFKTLLSRIAPSTFDAWLARRHNRHSIAFMDRLGIPAITKTYIERHGLTVAGGCFRGMNYIETPAGSALLPKLIGSYEEELLPAIEHAQRTLYGSVVDVGCAEGYYAVGLARTLPQKPSVFAYDLNPEAQALCRDLARSNEVSDQVTVLGRCDATELRRRLTDRSLVVCDCEGYEMTLLDPAEVPALLQTDIIVELHPWLQPDVAAVLQQRFSSTHNIETIPVTGRDPSRYPIIGFLSASEQKLALSEFRPAQQQWLFMRSR